MFIEADITLYGGMTLITRLKIQKKLFLICSYLFFRVLTPNKSQIGQKLRMLVRIRIPAKIHIIIARGPVITFVKFRMIKRAAISNLITMSMVPTFFFMEFNFRLKY
jgi:hypothetical protein